MPVTLPPPVPGEVTAPEGQGYEELPEPGRTAPTYMIWTGLVQPLEVFGR
jgi:hypothetical protein